MSRASSRITAPTAVIIGTAPVIRHPRFRDSHGLNRPNGLDARKSVNPLPIILPRAHHPKYPNLLGIAYPFPV
jgi:hypothetical protein